MLSVKSSGLKSSGEKSIKSWAYTLLSPFLLLPSTVFAEQGSFATGTSVLSIFLSLLLVVAIVFMLAFLMRRFTVTQHGAGQLKIVASMMAGTRERVMVLQVGDEQHLLGVTGHNINHLAKLDTPLSTPDTSSGEDFKAKLTQMMAGKLAPANKAGKE